MPDYFDAAARPAGRERDGPAWLTVLLTAAVVGAAVAIAEKYAAHEAHWALYGGLAAAFVLLAGVALAAAGASVGDDERAAAGVFVPGEAKKDA